MAEGGTNIMTSILAGMTTLITGAGSAFDFITGNAYLCVFAAGGILSMCFGFIKKGKKAVR